jgi:hypothetical protein
MIHVQRSAVFVRNGHLTQRITKIAKRKYRRYVHSIGGRERAHLVTATYSLLIKKIPERDVSFSWRVNVVADFSSCEVVLLAGRYHLFGPEALKVETV